MSLLIVIQGFGNKGSTHLMLRFQAIQLLTTRIGIQFWNEFNLFYNFVTLYFLIYLQNEYKQNEKQLSYQKGLFNFLISFAELEWTKELYSLSWQNALL